MSQTKPTYEELEQRCHTAEAMLAAIQSRQADTVSGEQGLWTRRLAEAEETVRLNMARLSLALEAAQAGTWEWDLKTNENIWSEELWPVYGLEPHSCQPSYEAWQQTIHPADRARAAQVVQEAAANGIELNAEWRVLDQAGAERWLMSRGRPVRDATGEVARYIGIVFNITERKRMEELLQKSERTLQLFVEYAPAAIAMFDRNMVYLAASRRYQADYRLKEQSLVGRSHYDIFPEMPERWKEIHRRCLAGATEICAEDPFPREDGTLDWVRWEIHPWYEHNTEVGGIILFSEVITERKQVQEALHESESHFRQLAESLPQLVWTCQPGGLCDYLSQRWVEYTGLPEATQLGFGWLEQLHPDDREPTIAAWNAAVTSGSDFIVEFRLRRHDGLYRWFDTRAVRLRDNEGRTVKWFGSNTDIQTQHELREALRENEERLAFALEVSQMGAWEFSLVDHTAYRSLQHARIFGYETPLPGWTFEKFLGHIIPEDRTEVERMISQAIAARRDWSIECRIRRCDDEIRWIWVAGRYRSDPIRDTRKMVGGIILDITERKRTEEKIRQSEEHYRGLFEHMVEGYAYCQVIFEDGKAQDWLYLVVNEAFETVTGLKDVAGKRASEVIPRIHETDPELLEIYARVSLSGASEKFEMFVETLQIWFSVSVYSPETGYFGAVFEVITARKQAEEELRQTASELARSNTELEQFAYIASHDLQEPLRAVGGMLQLLQVRYAGQLDARADEFIQHAVEGAARMQTLITDLLAFSRVATRGQPLQPTDCATIVQNVLANLAVAIQESGAVITYDPLPEVMADPTQLSQLFQNLLANAIKFRGEASPVIHIGVEPKEDEYLFAIRDNGIGIDSQYFERIFVIFQRLHTRQEYPGTGIGLAVCKKIVERHGGRMWVESEPGQGSTFYFTLSTKRRSELAPSSGSQAERGNQIVE